MSPASLGTMSYFTNYEAARRDWYADRCKVQVGPISPVQGQFIAHGTMAYEVATTGDGSPYVHGMQYGVQYGSVPVSANEGTWYFSQWAAENARDREVIRRWHPDVEEGS